MPRFFPVAIAILLAMTLVRADDNSTEPAPVQPPIVPQTVTVMPEAFTSFGACAQGNYAYLIGGHTGAAHDYNREGYNHNFYRLNLLDRTSWEILPGDVGLQSVSLVSDGTRLIRVGGMAAKNAPGEKADLQSSDAVAAYDPLTRQWTDLPKLPATRSSHDAIVLDGKLFVFGGWRLSGSDEGEWLDKALSLDLKADKAEWKSFSQPFKRRGFVAAATGGKLYVIGGMDEEGMSAKVNLYDPKEGKWSQGPDLPGMAFGSGAVELNGRVYATTMQGGLYSHAPGEEKWREEGTLTFPRFFHRLIVAGEQLGAIGGTGRGGQIRNIEWLTPGAKGPKVTRVTMPAPGGAKCRQGVFFVNNELYVFGGNNAVEDHQFEPENFLDESFKISINGLSVERIATVPVKRQSFQTFVVGGEDRFAEKLGYAVGGFGHGPNPEAGKSRAQSQSEIFQYSLDANVWETAKIKLPASLTQFGTAQYEGRLYLFGGMDFDASRGSKAQFQESDAVWMLDPKAKEDAAKTSFSALDAKLPVKRRAFGGAVLGDKYYIVGGMTKDFEELDQCDVYDFKTGKWSSIPNPADARLSPRLIPLNGKLYLVGGSSPTLEGFRRNSSVEVFDPATGKWSMLIADLGENLGELQAFAYGQSILLYSVHNEEGEIRLVFIQP